jgi:hypothetical protein
MDLTRASSRPYFTDTAIDLLQRGQDTEDAEELSCIVYELQHRKKVSPDSKIEILNKMFEELKNWAKSPTDKDHDNHGPGVSDYIKTRRQQAIDSHGFDWRDIGLLRASGYSVGISSDIKAGKRRDILDYILLHDDLSDITDLTYKAEWGRANTELRLKKMVDSLVMFAKNAKKQERNYDLAIKSWEEDLRYIEYTHGAALGSLDDHYIGEAIYSITKLSSE